MRPIECSRMMRRILAVAIVAVTSISCHVRPGLMPPAAPDVRGVVVGRQFLSAATGLGHLNRLELCLDRGSPPSLPPFALIYVDSSTHFEAAKEVRVDWTQPALFGAFVRVWFRGPMSTPTDRDFVAHAMAVAIDSIVPLRPPRANP